MLSSDNSCVKSEHVKWGAKMSEQHSNVHCGSTFATKCQRNKQVFLRNDLLHCCWLLSTIGGSYYLKVSTYSFYLCAYWPRNTKLMNMNARSHDTHRFCISIVGCVYVGSFVKMFCICMDLPGHHQSKVTQVFQGWEQACNKNENNTDKFENSVHARSIMAKSWILKITTNHTLYMVCEIQTSLLAIKRLNLHYGKSFSKAFNAINVQVFPYTAVTLNKQHQEV